MATAVPAHPQFEGLPTELKLKILSYLPIQVLARTASRVCKSWNQLSKNPKLWEEVHITWRDYCLDHIRNMLSRCTMLTNLVISARDAGVQTHFNFGTTFNSLTLKALTITFAFLYKDLLHQLNERLPSLENLTLRRCTLFEGKETFIENLCRLTNLKHLTLYVVGLTEHLNDDFFNRIATTFTNLETLDLLNSTSLSNQCIINFIQLRRHTLKKVKLHGSIVSDEAVGAFSLCSGLLSLGLNCTSDITDAAFDALEGIPLRTMELDCFTRFNDQVSAAAISKFLKHHNRWHLTRLLLSGFENLNNYVLCDVAHFCPHITQLFLSGTDRVSNEGLTYIGIYLAHLKLIHIKECQYVTPEVIPTLPLRITVIFAPPVF